MRVSGVCSTAIASAALAWALSPVAPAVASRSASGHRTPNHKVAHGTSTNWSGYAVQGAGQYRSVSASWTQPAAECARTPRGWSAFWVGLDGDTTNTVEQTGTEADCSSGKPLYYAWYEMYPKYPVNYANPVAPKDQLTASVNYLGSGSFRLTLSDTSQHWSQTTTQRLKSAKLGSAEVIAEAPSGSGGVLPLADFGTVGFEDVRANGSLLTASTPGVEPIKMVSGATVKAAPSAIGSGAFSDAWNSE